jgi:hypothetical protein
VGDDYARLDRVSRRVAVIAMLPFLFDRGDPDCRALIKKLDDPVERNDAIEQLAYLKERGRGAIPRNMRPKLIR